MAALELRPRLVAHAALETYSVLTRLPDPFRADPRLVVEYLAATFPGERLALSEGAQVSLPERMERAGIHGGAVYDGVVAATAHAHGSVLLSLDRRAAVAYARLEVDFRPLV